MHATKSTRRLARAAACAAALSLFCGALAAAGWGPPAAEAKEVVSALLNELKVNAPARDNPFEYVELKGRPGGGLLNLYFVALEGDADANPGRADMVFDLSPYRVGPNGVLLIKSPTGGHAPHPAAGATVATDPQLDTENGGLEDGSNSFLLVLTTTPLSEGFDYDADDDGTLDALPAGAQPLDAVAFDDGGAGDRLYGGAVLSLGADAPEAATRLPSDQTPASASAWYHGELGGSLNNSLTYDPSAASANLPPGGRLTPGVPNAPAAVAAGQLVISEFRLRGPAGASDEFVEFFNATSAPLTVSAADGSAGFALATAAGPTGCLIPNGTSIPAGGHFLCVNSVGYSLALYPAGVGVGDISIGDDVYAADIPDDAGLALFSTADAASFTPANRLDAAGFASAPAAYREGAGLGAAVTQDSEHSFARSLVGGRPRDTGDNASDFRLLSADGQPAGAGLGAPSPENLSSPVERNASFAVLLLDATKPASAAPNRLRDLTPNPSNNSTFGTLTVRRRVTNHTGAHVSRLRFRVTDLTTSPAPASVADLRALTSGQATAAGVTDAGTCVASNGSAGTPCTVVVRGTTLEAPPAQARGGGNHSSLSAATVTFSTPLAPGASINVQFVLGVQQSGPFRFFINVEALNGPDPNTL